MNNYVLELEVYNNNLIATGTFTSSGSTFLNHIAKWNDSGWVPLGTGLSDEGYGLAVYNNSLITSGYFNYAGGNSVNHIAGWNDSGWAPLGTGLNSWAEVVTVYVNCVVAGGGFTSAGGVSANYIAKWNDFSGIKKINELNPLNFSLSQNYPNPFNPVTIIKYQLPVSNQVKLVIYDVLGREIAVLVNEKQSAGTYQVEWSATGGGTNYPSGVYFYKLETDDYSETRKMVLIK